MRQLLVFVMMLSLAGSVAVSAQGKGKGKEKGNAGKGKPETHVVVKDKSPDGHVAVVFNETQRGAVHSYFVNTYGRGNCPPGLAKKNNGCLPPGQAKKRYVVGQRLPNGVVITELPPALVTRIGAAPAGYRYGLVDGDLVKLAIGSMLVVDAIDGFVR
jgi:hypothetical protein